MCAEVSPLPALLPHPHPVPAPHENQSLDQEGPGRGRVEAPTEACCSLLNPDVVLGGEGGGGKLESCFRQEGEKL